MTQTFRSWYKNRRCARKTLVFRMIHSLRLVIGLLACLAFASALPALFPRDKVTTYRYYAEVQTEMFNPESWVSQFVISGLMHVTPELSDPNRKNAFYVSLDVTHGVQNGRIDGSKKIAEDRLKPIPDAAEALKDPFVAVFGDNGKVNGLIVNKNEAEWSKNIKRSIASMLQLDLSSMLLQTPMESQKFSTNENTLYGECTVDYNIKSKPDNAKMFVVTKAMKPTKCTKFSLHTFNFEEPVDRLIEKKNNLNISSERIFDIENNGENLLIKKLVAHGLVSYSPWKDGSEPHYVLSSQTLNFESSVPVGSITLPTLTMSQTVLLNDVTFQKSQSHYSDKAGIDLTYGRRVVHTEALVTKVIELLGEAAEYTEENRWNITAPELQHGQTMSRLLDAMTYLDVTSIESISKRFIDETRDKSLQTKISMNQILLQILPYVGTEATYSYILQIIRQHRVPHFMAIGMLTKIPFYVRAPTEELLVEMEGLMSFGDEVSTGVRKAGIFAFATLIHKALRYEKYHHPLNPELVSRYVNQYFDHVMNETSYETKVLYIQALKNIGTSDVFRILEPIVSGKVVLSEKPQYLRLMAMYACEGASHSDADIDTLFWPILEDKQSPLEIRSAALTILLKQSPQLERFTRVFDLMKHEENEHLYNYFYTVMENFADSSRSHLIPFKEIASRILRETELRRPASNDITTSTARFDYENRDFGFAESWTIDIVADEHTGTPFLGVVEYSSSDGESPGNPITLFLRVEGVDHLIGNSPWDLSVDNLALPIEKIKNLLKKAGKDFPDQKPIHLEIAVMYQGRFIISEYYNKDSLWQATTFFDSFNQYFDTIKIWHDVAFDKVYTKHVSNDLGLPTVFENRIPRVISLQKNIDRISDTLIFEFGVKLWSHGYQSMEVYNPIIDTWHAIRRVSAVDASLPFAMNITIHDKLKLFTLTLPRLPTTEYSVTYSRTFYKNYVMVIGGKEDVLELYYPDRNLIEMVSSDEGSKSNGTLFSYDSVETGLRYSYEQHCDTEESSRDGFSGYTKTFNSFFEIDEDIEWEDFIAIALLARREHELYMLTDARSRGCENVVQIEPSHVYPTSEIEINVSLEESTTLPKKLSLNAAREVSFNVSVVVKAEPTKALVQSLTVTGFWNFTEGDLQNDVQFDVTYRSAADGYTKLCIDARKTYPPIVSDPFDRTVNPNSKTSTLLRIIFGKSETEACPSDGISLRVEVEGKMSDEQKEALEHGEIHDGCQKDIDNPLYMYAESSIVPRTPACLREAILRTTLRQYIVDIFYKNLPEELLDMILDENPIDSIVSANTTTLAVNTEPGHIKISVDFPHNNNGLNLKIRTPNNETQYSDLLRDADEGWDDVLDNIYFSSDILDSIQDKENKFCAIYPEILMNADGATTPYTVTGQWTLVTGDYKNYLFSVFVKRIEPKKLGLLLSVTNHTIEVIPTDTNPVVTVDGQVISYDHDLTVPKDEDEDEDEDESLAYRISWIPNPKRFKVESKFSAFNLEWSERFVSLVLSPDLHGKVTGLCGHLDGTYKERLARVYTIEE